MLHVRVLPFDGGTGTKLNDEFMKKIALFLLGRYIKKQAWKYSCASFAISEEMYKWITDAPVRQWRVRLWCIRHSYCAKSYEDLYEWLTRRRKFREKETGRQKNTSGDPLKELNEELIAMYNDLQHDTDEYTRKLIEDRRKSQPSSGM